MRIKPLLFLLVVGSLAAYIMIRGVGGPPLLKIGEPVPDFVVKDSDGKEVHLSDFRGKVVFLNIWATWCLPCVEEMPEMQQLHDRFGGRPFHMMAVSIDTEWNPIAEFYRKHQLDLPTYLDPGQHVKTAYRATGVPETFIIDGNGLLVRRYIGQMRWATPQMFTMFEDLIATQETRASASR